MTGKVGSVERTPQVYEAFKAEEPAITAAFEQLSATVHGSGPLAMRERRLVKLGIAIGTSSPGGVRSQVRKALGEGFTRAEIEHAIHLSITTTGFPAMIAALTWSREVPDAGDDQSG
jgi:alkylhydroperoxidase/carboxymuconolactone decarboxylase family protein YurZ